MGKIEIPLGTKIGVVAIIVVLLLIIGLFAFLLINCITNYSDFDINYSDLIFQELAFVRYERIPQGKSSYAYDIYFKEYEKPFRIDSIASKKVDKVALKLLTEGQVIQVYLHQQSYENSDYYEICEMFYNNTEILSLSNYVEVNQNNQIVGMIVCPLLILSCSFLLWLLTRMFKPKRTKDDWGSMRMDDDSSGSKYSTDKRIN